MADGKTKSLDAHFSGPFGVVGIKNSELAGPLLCIWKGRIVVGGDNIQISQGYYAIFEAITPTPGSLTAARLLSAVNVLAPHLELSQANAICACVQAGFRAPPTWVTQPPECCRESWILRGLQQAVVRLSKVRHGHPLSVEFWHCHIKSILAKKFGFKEVERWPSVSARTLMT